MNRLAVILNASAGSVTDDLPHQIAKHFADRGSSSQLRVVSGAEIAETTRQARREGAEVIAAGGGDGTISTVASVLAGSETAMGVLPLGTLNHFAKDLNIPQQIDSAIDTIVGAHTISIDLGEVNGRTFINNSSLGVYPSIVAERDYELRKGHQKVVALALALVRVWKRYPLIAVTLRDESVARIVRTPFVFVGNGEYLLEGINKTRRKSHTGGKLHICSAPNISRFEGVRMVVAALAGRLHQLEYFESFLETRLDVEVPRAVSLSLDGEVTTLKSPLGYRTRPKALRVIVPAAGPAEE
jgi:diacylglycerol kinase family enzyme